MEKSHPHLIGLGGIISFAEYPTPHRLQEAQLFNGTRLTSRYQTPQAQDEWSGLVGLSDPAESNDYGSRFLWVLEVVTLAGHVFFTKHHVNTTCCHLV